MIASVRGRVGEVLTDAAVIEVGGIGYRVFLAPRTLSALVPGAEAVLHTVTYVREDTLALYGFATLEERDVFEQLLGTTGVGPKLALAVLAIHPPAALRRIVAAADADALTAVPGVGRKGAARLVLELRGKLGEPELAVAAAPGGHAVYADVRAALTGLGYGPAEVRAALEELPCDAADLPPEAVLRLALRVLGGRRVVTGNAG